MQKNFFAGEVNPEDSAEFLAGFRGRCEGDTLQRKLLALAGNDRMTAIYSETLQVHPCFLRITVPPAEHHCRSTGSQFLPPPNGIYSVASPFVYACTTKAHLPLWLNPGRLGRTACRRVRAARHAGSSYSSSPLSFAYVQLDQC